MYIKDNEQEYEESWRKDTLKNFETEFKGNTVTVVWDSIPYHLSNSWMEKVFKEIQEIHDYKPTEWVICANVIYMIFERENGSGNRMEALQKACYEKF